MSSNFFDGLNRLLGGNPSARRVADDLQLTSELILLIRMIYADGELNPEETKAFNTMCQSVFGLDEADIPGVLQYLKDFGYETSTWDAASMFKSYSIERKKELLVHLLQIAKADHNVDASEAELIRKTAHILGMTPEQIKA